MVWSLLPQGHVGVSIILNRYKYDIMYVCMYVHTYVCTYVCMYVHTYVCTYVCMYVRTYVQKVNWIGHNLRINCFLKGVVEGKAEWSAIDRRQGSI
jgi:hypothetical protein